MYKIEYSIEEIKKIYEVAKRCSKVIIAGLVISVSAVSSFNATAADMKFDFSDVKAEVLTEARMPRDFMKTLSSIVWDNELSELSKLPANWDGEGASAVSQGAVAACRKLMKMTAGHLSQLDSVYPTSFGSLCMEWRVGNSWINAEITASTISFYLDKGDDDIHTYDKMDISDKAVESLLDCLEEHNA